MSDNRFAAAHPIATDPISLDPLTLMNALLAVSDIAASVADPRLLEQTLRAHVQRVERGGSATLAHNIELASRVLLRLQSPHVRKPLEDHLIRLATLMNRLNSQDQYI